MLTIGTTVDPRFYQLLESIPLEIRKIEGIDKIDPFLLANEYMKSGNVADVSVDPNANVSGKSPVSMDSEIFKGIKKVRNYFLLWKQLEKNHGLEHANKIMYHIFTSPLYFHDITKIEVPYCFAPDTSFWMTAGRPYGWLPGGAPKKAYSFVGQTVEVAMDFSQENAGAIGLANFLVNLAYCTKLDKQQLAKSAIELQSAFNDGALGATDIAKIIAGFYAHNDEQYNKYVAEIKNDLEADIDVKEILFKYYGKFVQDMLQQFVHVMHNTFRIGGDSPFTNLSLFCKDTIKKTFADAYYPDMSSPADNIDEIMWVQDLYIDFFSKGSPITEKNYRFPVSTVNINTRPLTEEEKKQFPNKKCRITDDKFFEKLARKNARRGVFNWHKGEKIASCCLSPETKVLIKGREGIKVSAIGNLGQHDKEIYEVFHEGRFIKAKFVRVPYKHYREVTLTNGLTLLMTGNHKNITLDGVKDADSLTENDYLPVNLTAYEGNGCSYEQGFLVGAFLGDGSCKSESTTVFSLNNDSKLETLSYIKSIVSKLFGGHCYTRNYGDSKLVSLEVYSYALRGLIKEFVSGDTAKEKELNSFTFEMSKEFRQGILDGLYATDGGNSNRIYTSSIGLRDSLVTLCNTLGFATNINIVDEREGRLGNNSNYCIRIYAPSKRTKYMDIYKIQDGRMWFRVKNIKDIIKQSNAVAYCFEVIDDEPEFTLANGIITHNCRLTSDLSKLKETIKMDSFGNGGLSIGCYDNETEVLTNNGWRFFKDLDREDKICTLNPNTKEIEYQLPTTYFKSRYSGEMHRYNHESLDFLVTPNHNMAVISRKTKEFSLIQSKDLKSGFNLFRLGAKNKNKEKGNIIVGKSVFKSYSFFEFLGFYLGDGSIYHDEQEAKKRAYEISFFLKKERKITYIERVLNDLGLEFRKDYIKSRDSFNIHVYNKDIWEYLRLLGKCKEKRIPRDILLSYSNNELKGLFDGLINSDGTIKNGTWLYTSSEQLKNDFEELCILLGFQFHTFYREGEVVIDDRIIESNCYEIKVLMKEREVYKLSKYKEITTYNGNIYCVEVPNHIIAVKRNGTVMWCGNSHRVVTLDLHGIAMEAVKDKKSFFKVLNDFQLFAEQALIAHKQILQDVVDKRLLKFFNIKWANMNMFFSTFGFVGLYDAYKILKSYGVEKRTYVTFAKETLHQLEDYAEYAGMRNPGFAFNVEEVPAETAAIKMAQKDNYLYFNTVNYKRVELLSNQMIPLYVDEFSVDERLSIMGELMNINSGGAICHLNVDSSMTEEVSIELTREMIEDYDIPHFAMNIGTTTCVNCHTTIGIYQECPVCRDKVKTWTTRVVGFNTDTEDWHSVRRNWEMPRRTWYKSDDLL